MVDDQAQRGQRQWYIVERWQEYEGEARANLLRIIAIGSFYVVHLLNHFGYLEVNLGQTGQSEEAARQFHYSVTALAVAWTMVSLGVLVCLRQRIFPAWLKFASTGADIVLLTSVLWVANGPRSPLVVGYFLILVLSALRLSLPLVRVATVGTMLGYICLLGCAKWPETFGRAGAEMHVPRYEQLMTLLALGLAGVMLGQIIRRVRHLAEDFASRLGAARKESA